VLDVRLPGQSGLDLQRKLASANRGSLLAVMGNFFASVDGLSWHYRRKIAALHFTKSTIDVSPQGQQSLPAHLPANSAPQNFPAGAPPHYAMEAQIRLELERLKECLAKIR